MILVRRLIGALQIGLLWDAGCDFLRADNARLFSLARAQAAGDWSVRVESWGSDRRVSNDKGVLNAEAWIRGSLNAGQNVSLRYEGWVGTDPRGLGEVGADLREGLIEISLGQAKLRAGRQILSWGRADRINPTDVLAARDYRRLVVDEDENRLGQTVASLSVPLLGGALSGYWSPEFRVSELPIGNPAGGGLFVRQRPKNAQAFAVRYERFGSGFDFSLNASQTPDHTPWLVLDGPLRPSSVALRYPTMRTVGGDFATSVGSFGLRVEAAAYWHDSAAVSGVAGRVPRFAAVIGIDRSFPGQWLVTAQALARRSAMAGPVPASLAPLAAKNDVMHGAWRPTIFGGTISVRKTFAADRGRAEFTAAWLSGGGAYFQAKTSLRLTQSVNVQFLGERHVGTAESYLGRLRANNLVMIGLKAGF